jgi:hypothetical protein
MWFGVCGLEKFCTDSGIDIKTGSGRKGQVQCSLLRGRLLEEAADEGAGEVEGGSVDDVGGPVFELVGGWGLGGGWGEAEGGDGDLVGTEEEEGAVGESGSGGDLGDVLCGGGVEDAHEGSEGEVDGLACGLFLLGREGVAGSLDQFASDDLGGALLLLGLLLGELLVSDGPGGFSFGQPALLFEGFFAGGDEGEELVHDQSGEDSRDGSDGEGAGEGRGAAGHGWLDADLWESGSGARGYSERCR